jgi:hypothetical protein
MQAQASVQQPQAAPKNPSASPNISVSNQANTTKATNRKVGITQPKPTVPTAAPSSITTSTPAAQPKVGGLGDTQVPIAATPIPQPATPAPITPEPTTTPTVTAPTATTPQTSGVDDYAQQKLIFMDNKQKELERSGFFNTTNYGTEAKAQQALADQLNYQSTTYDETHGAGYMISDTGRIEKTNRISPIVEEEPAPNGGGITQPQPNVTPQNIGMAPPTPAAPITSASTGKYSQIVERHAAKTGLPATLINAVIKNESGGNPSIVSPDGSYGLMQLKPATAAARGVSGQNIYDPESNIKAGTEELSTLVRQYNGDIPKALTAYNWGQGNLAKHGGDINRAPASTKAYVKRVIADMRKNNTTPTAPQPNASIPTPAMPQATPNAPTQKGYGINDVTVQMGGSYTNRPEWHATPGGVERGMAMETLKRAQSNYNLPPMDGRGFLLKETPAEQNARLTRQAAEINTATDNLKSVEDALHRREEVPYAAGKAQADITAKNAEATYHNAAASEFPSKIAKNQAEANTLIPAQAQHYLQAAKDSGELKSAAQEEKRIAQFDRDLKYRAPSIGYAGNEKVSSRTLGMAKIIDEVGKIKGAQEQWKALRKLVPDAYLPEINNIWNERETWISNTIEQGIRSGRIPSNRRYDAKQSLIPGTPAYEERQNALKGWESGVLKSEAKQFEDAKAGMLAQPPAQ